MNTLGAFLASRRLTFLLVIAWFTTMFFTYVVLRATADDGIYLIPALTTLHTGVPGILIGDNFHPAFFFLPTYSFLHGLFLKFLDTIRIEPNVYNYRLFNFVLTTAFFGAALYLLGLLHKGDVARNTARNLLLAFIGITPFAQQYMIARPEVFALLLLTIALIFIFYWEEMGGRVLLIFAGLLLGMVAILHPNFVFLVGMLCLVFLQRQRRYFSNVILLGVAAALPVLALLGWIGINWTEASEQLFHRADEMNPTGLEKYYRGIEALLERALGLVGGERLTVRLFNMIFWSPLLLFFGSAVIWMVVRLVRFGVAERAGYLVALVAGTLLILILMGPYKPYFIVMTYISLLAALQFFVPSLVGGRFSNLPLGRVGVGLLGLVMVGMVGLNSVIHVVKMVVTDSTYYNTPTTGWTVGATLKTGDVLFLDTGKQVPAFTGLFDGAIEWSKPLISVYWLFPLASSIPPKSWQKEIDDFIGNRILNMPTDKMVWGINKKRALFASDRQQVCLAVTGSNVPVLLSGIRGVYEDKDHLFVRIDNISLLSAGAECSTTAFAVADGAGLESGSDTHLPVPGPVAP